MTIHRRILRASFITSNPSKVEETQAILKSIYQDRRWATLPVLELNGRSLPNLSEIQDLSVGEVARCKAGQAFQMVGEPVLVEDSGLYLHAWGLLPGSFIKFFLSEVGQDGLLRMMNGFPDRRALAETSFGYVDQHQSVMGVGRLHGWVADSARGSAGFGWDGIFVPAGTRRPAALAPKSGLPTFAELDPIAKNSVSMRRKALVQLLKRLAVSSVGRRARNT